MEYKHHVISFLFARSQLFIIVRGNRLYTTELFDISDSVWFHTWHAYKNHITHHVSRVGYTLEYGDIQSQKMSDLNWKIWWGWRGRILKNCRGYFSKFIENSEIRYWRRLRGEIIISVVKGFDIKLTDRDTLVLPKLNYRSPRFIDVPASGTIVVISAGETSYSCVFNDSKSQLRFSLT